MPAVEESNSKSEAVVAVAGLPKTRDFAPAATPLGRPVRGLHGDSDVTHGIANGNVKMDLRRVEQAIVTKPRVKAKLGGMTSAAKFASRALGIKAG